MGTVSDCESTSIVITSEVDTEIQVAAQIFVDDLISRARKEADVKISEKQQRMVVNGQNELETTNLLNGENREDSGRHQRQNVPITVQIIREVLHKRCQRAYGFFTNCLGKMPQ